MGHQYAGVPSRIAYALKGFEWWANNQRPRPGGVIDVDNEISPKARRRFYQIAAAIADHLASTTQGRRKQRSR
ncbi:MAG: hypothetical protein ACM4D3_15620 [Candidatus Sericytochromatia bacterium]